MCWDIVLIPVTFPGELDDDKGLSTIHFRMDACAEVCCRLASHQWDSSYQDLLQLYQLPSLEEHRLHLKNLMFRLMFKIIHNFCYYPEIPSFHDNIHRRAAHALQFKFPFAHTNANYFSYYPHTMSVWIANVLPSS